MSMEVDGLQVSDAPAVFSRGLCKRYGKTVALDGVDFHVPEGAVYALIGANAAGKSTALRTMLNVERPDSGSVRVLGLETSTNGPAVRAQVGYMSDGLDAGYRWMPCSRLLRFVAAHYPSWDAAYADHLSIEFALPLARKVGDLSKGEARRLQLVLALAHRPPLLLLDEPTDGLDPVIRKHVIALMAKHLADTPTTAVISTHHVSELESLADHVGVLSRGQLIAQLSRDELRLTVRRYRLRAPAGWQPPPDVRSLAVRRSPGRRELECTLLGDELELSARLAHAGAEVIAVSPLSLEDAALAFLTEGVA